ncbi:hypothetical protein MKEN_00550200 [Mycena kentingensis (nom. inval.)]|nr:hypothetical protein MKEN_00550200 [Mycena kentingensis (nom. inval.)]
MNDKGAERLLRILLSESAFLAWKLRCERVIQSKGEASNAEIRNRWLKAINSRLEMDCALTNTTKYGKKALRKGLIKATWKGTLENEISLPDDWMSRETGVLVGVG